MKIVRDDIKTEIFADLRDGTVFEYLGDFYIKTEEIFVNENDSDCKCRLNAVRLSRGEFNLIEDYEKVQVFPEAFLTIK